MFTWCVNRKPSAGGLRRESHYRRLDVLALKGNKGLELSSAKARGVEKATKTFSLWSPVGVNVDTYRPGIRREEHRARLSLHGLT